MIIITTTDIANTAIFFIYYLSPALEPKFGFYGSGVLLRRSPKPDATSNNFFGPFERPVTGVETLFPVPSGAVSLAAVLDWNVQRRVMNVKIKGDSEWKSLSRSMKLCGGL
jgi:hypothetical protein